MVNVRRSDDLKGRGLEAVRIKKETRLGKGNISFAIAFIRSFAVLHLLTDAIHRHHTLA